MNYQLEKKNLVKKLVSTALLMFLGGALMAASSGDISSIIIMALVFGLVFYVPARIKEIINCGLIVGIIIGIVYVAILATLNNISIIFPIIMSLFPIADIAYSIYKIIKLKKETTQE